MLAQRSEGFFGRGQSLRPDHRVRGTFARGRQFAAAPRARGRFSTGQSTAIGHVGTFADGR